MIRTLRIWDLPTRVFHWTLVTTTVGLIVSGQMGGGMMEWHFRAGYLMIGLLLFRLIWGFVGGRWSRFVNFPCSPSAVLRYVHRPKSGPEHLGHNPLGALSVIVMLTLLLAQVASGLGSDDEIGSAGPLTAHLSGSWVETLTSYHKGIGKPALLGWIGLHLVAIAVHSWRGHQLVKPMLTGNKLTEDSFAPASQDDLRHRRFAALVAAACAVCVLAVGALL